MNDIDQARHWLTDATAVVGFTGAGISTESGIPDFRSPDGVWSRNRTVLYDEFVANHDDRVEYWRQKALMWPEIRDAVPNAGHHALVSLRDQGKLSGVITQNIDGLHVKSGLADTDVVELHGTTCNVVCLSCGELSSMDAACERIAAGDLAPECHCGGFLKPNTVSFGQMLPPGALERAADLARASDVFLAVGSSLVVQPAASFPRVAKQGGARLIIINRDETPLDGDADLVFHAAIGEVLPRMVEDA